MSIFRPERNPETGSVIWHPSNVYPTAQIGKNVSIGTFCEIGPNVVIGDNVRIGAYSFIPEGFTIEDGAFIGPRFTGTNDRKPPSSKEYWEPTTIKKNARVGAAVTVRCGVTIGEGALIGTGSVVTKNVPPFETWVGVPAARMPVKGW